MNCNQICVTDIYVKGDNNNEYEFLASINNIMILRKWIAIGESVTSNEFGMIFPNSIGQSKWKLLFYPRGQYADGHASSCIGIYLVMVSCERRESILKANVAFQLHSQMDEDDDAGHGSVVNLNAEFNYSDPNKRWIGAPNFVAKSWLNAKRRLRFCKNDSLIIRCSVEETKTSWPDDIKTSEDNDKQKGCISLDDFQNSNDTEWYMVSSKRGKEKMQPKNPVNVDDANASKAKSSNPKGKRKKNSNKGGKKKK